MNNGDVIVIGAGSVGANVASTSKVPPSLSSIPYSSEADFLSAAALTAVTGNTVIAESVSPKSGISSQWTSPFSVFAV